MSNPIKVITNSENVEKLLAPYKSALGQDYDAYRGHVYRTISYAMHFLGNDEKHLQMVETAFVYHDIGLWTDKDLAYLEPSEALALRDNLEKDFGLDPDILRSAIHWHHKITPYTGKGANIVNAVRKGDWVDASQGKIRKGLTRAQVSKVQDAIPDFGFPDVLQRLARELGGNPIKGNIRVLLKVFKF